MKRYVSLTVLAVLFGMGLVWAGIAHFGIVPFVIGAFFAVPLYCLARLFRAIVHRLERNDGRRP
jgi:hypothetical protein